MVGAPRFGFPFAVPRGSDHDHAASDKTKTMPRQESGRHVRLVAGAVVAATFCVDMARSFVVPVASPSLPILAHATSSSAACSTEGRAQVISDTPL